ncbi:MAG TPA: 6-phosphogluconolactonase [Pararhizobium sp.]|nr:6-phosphogluconolactonase [Pararhizobium sp.]
MKESELRPIELHEFAEREALAAALATRVAEQLREAIAVRGRALLAVSGGETPKQFFEALSTEEADWEKVTVTLVDERFVSPDSGRSNQKLVETHLLKNKAARAKLVALYHRAENVDAAAEIASGAIDALPLPFDALILGMGTDGHTASFFPGGNHLGAALALGGNPSVLSMKAPDADEPRLTLTLPHVIAARLLVLHIHGAEKMRVLDKVRGAGPAEEMPIRAVLDHAPAPVETYWAA